MLFRGGNLATFFLDCLQEFQSVKVRFDFSDFAAGADLRGVLVSDAEIALILMFGSSLDRLLRILGRGFLYWLSVCSVSLGRSMFGSAISSASCMCIPAFLQSARAFHALWVRSSST